MRAVLDAGGRILIPGDYNSSDIPEEFGELDHLSPLKPTCHAQWYGWPFKNECLDHVAGEGFRLVEAKHIQGKSDHKAVSLELETIA